MTELGILPAMHRSRRPLSNTAARFTLGAPNADAALEDLPRNALHEIHAATAGDGVSASGFALAMALRAAPEGHLLWARHDLAIHEAGQIYGPGLVQFGLDPNRLTLVNAPRPLDLLRAAHDALRSGAFATVLIELWGKVPALDLTATRRLAMAAEEAGVMALLLRAAAPPQPSAATTRWRIAATPSVLADDQEIARPAFDATLLRHRGGVPPQTWQMEWCRDARSFRDPAPLFGVVVPVPVRRPLAPAAGTEPRRRFG